MRSCSSSFHHFVWNSVEKTRTNLMLITLRALRVKPSLNWRHWLIFKSNFRVTCQKIVGCMKIKYNDNVNLSKISLAQIYSLLNVINYPNSNTSCTNQSNLFLEFSRKKRAWTSRSFGEIQCLSLQCLVTCFSAHPHAV